MPAAVAADEIFLLSVAVGAGGTVILATLLGFPISTTHSLVGGIVGAGVMGAGSQIDTSLLMSVFLMPLFVSPFLAVVVAGSLYLLLHRIRRRLGVENEDCLCLMARRPLVSTAGPAQAMGFSVPPELSLVSAEVHACRSHYGGRVWGVGWQWLVDRGHFFSSGVVSFARGLNDTPKIAALLVMVDMVDVRGSLALVGGVIAVGGLMSAARVAHTMSHKITTMNDGQGLSANLATGLLVILASRFGIPVSTTHVSVGALVGIGVVSGGVDLGTTRNVALSWIVTLPCGAALSALTFAAAGALH